jgi:hypothetical protein
MVESATKNEISNEEITRIEGKHIKNKASPFLNLTKSWDDEENKIPEDI